MFAFIQQYLHYARVSQIDRTIAQPGVMSASWFMFSYSIALTQCSRCPHRHRNLFHRCCHSLLSRFPSRFFLCQRLCHHRNQIFDRLKLPLVVDSFSGASCSSICCCQKEFLYFGLALQSFDHWLCRRLPHFQAFPRYSPDLAHRFQIPIRRTFELPFLHALTPSAGHSWPVTKN